MLLKRGKRPSQCEVIHDHSQDDPPFPAVTISHHQDEWIVGSHELTTQVEIDNQLREEYKQTNLVPEILAAYAGGATTVRNIATKMGVQMIDVLSKFRKAQRLGLLPNQGPP